jgi:hypothetical protein
VQFDSVYQFSSCSGTVVVRTVIAHTLYGRQTITVTVVTRTGTHQPCDSQPRWQDYLLHSKLALPITSGELLQTRFLQPCARARQRSTLMRDHHSRARTRLADQIDSRNSSRPDRPQSRLLLHRVPLVLCGEHLCRRPSHLLATRRIAFLAPRRRPHSPKTLHTILLRA